MGTQELITVTGAGIRSPEMLWDRILDWMDVPDSVATAIATTASKSTSGKAAAEGGIPLVGKGGVEASTTSERGTEENRSREQRRQGMAQVVRELAESGFVLLIDDFHYMQREVQTDIAKQIKEAARQGVKICTASCTHRADDVVRGNPELRGRVRAIDVGYWSKSDLAKIPEQGFALLNARVDPAMMETCLGEVSGSPQLMQAVCLQTCFENGLRMTAPEARTISPDRGMVNAILEETAARTDFGTLVRDMHNGPARHAALSARSSNFVTALLTGDVYRVVLLALSADPARLSFPYNDLYQRIQGICRSDVPQAASIFGACNQIALIAEERRLPGELSSGMPTAACSISSILTSCSSYGGRQNCSPSAQRPDSRAALPNPAEA